MVPIILGNSPCLHGLQPVSLVPSILLRMDKELKPDDMSTLQDRVFLSASCTSAPAKAV